MSHLRLSTEQFKALSTNGKPKNKFNAKKKEIDGNVFDSTREARRWQDLALMQKAGDIRELRRQVPFSISIRGIHICDWNADFVYLARIGHAMEWSRIVEDSKGHKDKTYKLKKRMVEAEYGFKILET